MEKNNVKTVLKIGVGFILTILIVVVIYIFSTDKSAYEQIKRESYAWQANGRIVKISERFKGIEPGRMYSPGMDSRRREGKLLFPIIQVGMSTEEVRALLGEPYHIEPTEDGNYMWFYTLFYDQEIILYISNGKIIKKEI